MPSLRPLVFPPLHRVPGRARLGSRNPSRVGAVTGMQVFLTMALLLLLLTGSVTSERAASGIFGEPDAPSFGLTASLLLGIASAGIASVFAILVRVAGASVLARSRAIMLTRASAHAWAWPAELDPLERIAQGSAAMGAVASRLAAPALGIHLPVPGSDPLA